MVKTLFKLGFLLFTSVAMANQQDGSLNTYNGDGSNVNSNNTTEDKSVSNTYNGAGSSSEMPVGSAISPSYMSNGMDTCLKGTGGSLQTVGVGISSGTYDVDPECNRRRDAKVLSDLNMKVAAVARMCQSVDVWKAMFISGTPCPILSNGRLIVGKSGRGTIALGGLIPLVTGGAMPLVGGAAGNTGTTGIVNSGMIYGSITKPPT